MKQPTLVKDVMWKDVDIVDGMKTISEALEEMQHHKTKMLVVNKRHEFDEYGVVLTNDIATKVIAKNKSFERTNIYEVMTKPAISVNSDMDVKYCIRLLNKLNLSRCLVIDNKKIIGVVSLTNIVFGGLRVC
jgi:signal-transduction protein with cAMP-binding, CBS, and nucleotidyltransferase domain